MTTAEAVTTVTPQRTTRNLPRIYALESFYELLKVVRLPTFILPTLLFPAMFYLLFGVSFGSGKTFGDTGVATYLLATYGAFGVIGAALFGFGVSCAIERGQGWTLLKQASPMPVSAYFVAKLLVSVLMSAIVIGILLILGLAFGDVAWQPGTLAKMTGVLMLGVIPFNAFGVLIGLGAGPNSAPAIANIIYLPMAFVSGLWMPIQALPSFLQQVAVTMPAYHYSQLALKVLDADAGGSTIIHLAYLGVFSVICFTIAIALWKRDEGKTFG